MTDGICNELTNGDVVRTLNNQELEDWFWRMVEYVKWYTDSRVALHEWLNSDAKTKWRENI